MLLQETSLQATPPGYIRIGVVPSATSVEIGAAGDWVVRDKASGATLLGGSGDAATVRLLAAGEVRTRRWFQVTCSGNAAAIADLVARGQAAGFETLTEDIGTCTRVLFGSLPVGETAADREAFVAALGAAGLPTEGFWQTKTVVSGESQVEVTYGEESRVVGNPVVLESSDGIVLIDGAPYRGVVEVWTNSSGTLAAINELPLEQYLYGVVPRELPPGPYGLPEAQKAQAVAARTYALANMGKRSADGYDLLPTTSDQVYGGVAAEHPVSTAAVDATAGVVAVYNGALISTLYHSTSGGFTANSEDVYANAVPYLRGVPDAERGKALEHVPSLDVFMRHANPTNLRARAGGDFEADWSVYHRWVVTWTFDEMAQALSSGFGTTVTRVDSIVVTDRADHGRVREIVFYTDAGALVGTKDGIRSRLPYFNANGTLSSLRSTLFFIEPWKERGSIVGWKAYGGGWGHGVGMSQTGAVGMAERGRTYQEILAHYYQGSTTEVREY
ncbi:MAG: SpoIID/LytB domain-containing protein [Candidatus Cloacimonetes bacterium]|nr:SpoIID/LytB domain-containing protein [Candidatus Cloacimonadota bacterium]